MIGKKCIYVIWALFCGITFILGHSEVFADDEIKTTAELVKSSQKLLNQLAKPTDLTSRDPFSVSETVDIGSSGDGTYEFYPSEGKRSLPKLKLKGYIGDKYDDPMALLDIENHGVFLVRKGDTVGLQVKGRNTVIKIKDITKLSVLVEVGTIGQVVIVR